MGRTLVDELAHLVQSELLGSLAKDKEHGINDIRFATSVWADDTGKAFVKGTDLLESSIAFKVFE
jgi:hypothetical protein